MNLLGVDQWPLMLIFFVALMLCAAFLSVTRRLGKQFGLVDKPSYRKQHRGHIPLVGGASIFLTYVTMHLAAEYSIAVIAASGLLLLVGMADDYVDLSPLSRLIFQATAAGILVISGGYQVISIGNLIGDQAVVLGGITAVVFSIVCVVGVVNAINMIDGADGLAGGIVTISICALVFIAISNGSDHNLIAGLLTVLGATFAFLLFNTGFLGAQQKVFLGDSGSMFLGIVLATHYIGMSQGQSPYMTPVVAGWIFGLPLMDSISVMVGRSLRGESPLKAGRDHLHHRLMDSGISNAGCVLIMLLFHAALVLIGLLGNQFAFPMYVMFWGFVAMTIAHFFMTPRVIDQLSLRVNRPRSRRYS